jgi:hypothetical protein
MCGFKPWLCLGLESWMCFIAGLLQIWKILVRRSFKTGLPYVGRLWVAVINQYISTPSHNELSLVANVSNASCCYVQRVERIGFEREFYCLLFFWEHPSCSWKKTENCTQKQSLVGILAIQCLDSNMGLWMHISLLEKLFWDFHQQNAFIHSNSLHFSSICCNVVAFDRILVGKSFKTS